MYILLLFLFVPFCSCPVPWRSPARDRLVQATTRSWSPGPSRGTPPSRARTDANLQVTCTPLCTPLLKMYPTFARAKGHFEVVLGLKRSKYDHFSTFSDFDIDVPHVPQMGYKWGTKSSPPQM